MKNEMINKTKIAMVLNYIIFILVLFGVILMFTGYKISPLLEPDLKVRGFGYFKYFTVDANIIMGISAILLAHKERKLLNGSIKDITVGYYIFKFMALVSVFLTFCVVFLYLGKIVDGGIMILLQNSNLFFHLIVPILSVISSIIFERNDKLKIRYFICGLIPMLLYAIYYVINIFIHIDNGKVPKKYDLYLFAQNGVNDIYVAAGLIILFTVMISMVLILLIKKKK